MFRMHKDKFAAELLRPARTRKLELEAAVAAAERELETALRALDVDEKLADRLQSNVDALRRRLAWWTRRDAFLTGCENTVDSTDHVTIALEAA